MYVILFSRRCLLLAYLLCSPKSYDYRDSITTVMDTATSDLLDVYMIAWRASWRIGVRPNPHRRLD